MLEKNYICMYFAKNVCIKNSTSEIKTKRQNACVRACVFLPQRTATRFFHSGNHSLIVAKRSEKRAAARCIDATADLSEVRFQRATQREEGTQGRRGLAGEKEENPRECSAAGGERRSREGC